MASATGLAALGIAVWVYLLMFRGSFWLLREREDGGPAAAPRSWPRIVAVIPARDEAEVLPAALVTLLDQDYPGDLRVILIDDDSRDGTAAVARALAVGRAHPLLVKAAEPLPAGWTGKLWAVSQGIAAARAFAPDFLLLTDADIAYGPCALRRLAARSRASGAVLTSVMVRLRCVSFAERALIPAFVYFFRMLYPFRWANDPRVRAAAAAGGCMLIDPVALEAVGGIESIRSALIDDCALAARMKPAGRIWIGLSQDIASLRAYPTFADIGSMISRSAYAQLRYSPLLLAGCVLAMATVYFLAPALALFGSGLVRWLGLLTWLAMAISFAPTARFFGRSILWGLALPGIAAIYLFYTLRSAAEHGAGKGGMWKGRAQAMSETR